MSVKRTAIATLLLLVSALALAAVDSRDKRASANNAGENWDDVLPNPDSTIDQADRAMLVGEYHGFAYSGGGDPPSPVSGTNKHKHTFRFPGVWR